MLFIEYPKCSTCQKARKRLDSMGKPYDCINCGGCARAAPGRAKNSSAGALL